MDFEFSSVLVFCPHPDDGEFMAGGSMARWASEGKSVTLCVVTNGAMGSNDPTISRDDLIEMRRNEQRDAAKVMGLADVIFLGHEDGYVEDSHELRRDMIREIRRVKPDLVVGLDPALYYVSPWYINHPDHRNVGKAFLAAVNPGATTVPLYRDELHDKGFEAHQLKGCLLAFTDTPDYFVDITEYIDTKVEAIFCHKSQQPEFTPDVGSRIKEREGAMAKLSGKGYEYAEGFKSFTFPKGMPPTADPTAG